MRPRRILPASLFLVFCAASIVPLVRGGSPADPVWSADRGDGTYRNPIFFQDFPDPDGIRVGDQYYLVCSTFANAPALTLLQSPDLVNWTIVGHALDQLVPTGHFAIPHRGEGVWAPSLRHHDGKFWIFYPDPDFGLYVLTAEKFTGPWSAPHLLLGGKGLIDPCPFWDDDGQAYLIHGWARSRAGKGNILTLHRMSPDATRVLDEGTVVIDGDKLPKYRTLEGPKLYKRDGWYWVFAPAGGVAPGWQSVFRSKNIWGPYEDRIVLEQGNTPTNGPHQGAWIETPNGDSWFIHFQDRGPFGRITHLEPMKWRDDGWPVMGDDADGDGRGVPVLTHKKPDVGGAQPFAITVPATSDEFDRASLGLQWQWEANYSRDWFSLSAAPGALRLFSQPAENLWVAPNLLTQRIVGPASTVTTEISFAPTSVGERAGLVLMGRDYTWIGVEQTPEGARLVRAVCMAADRGNREEKKILGPSVAAGATIQLRVELREGAPWTLSASTDGGATFATLGDPFPARPGIWVGTRVGVFSAAALSAEKRGHADVSWFRVTP